MFAVAPIKTVGPSIEKISVNEARLRPTVNCVRCEPIPPFDVPQNKAVSELQVVLSHAVESRYLGVLSLFPKFCPSTLNTDFPRGIALVRPGFKGLTGTAVSYEFDPIMQPLEPQTVIERVKPSSPPEAEELITEVSLNQFEDSHIVDPN